MMSVELERVGAPFRFAATGSGNKRVEIDASPDIGGTGAGSRPMELLLMGLAGCAAIDVVQILKKQRLELADIRVSVRGERAASVPTVFTAITLHFELEGDLPAEKAERAIALSVEKYCPAAAMLRAAASVDFTVTIKARSGGRR